MISKALRTLAAALLIPLAGAACGGNDPLGSTARASLSGVVRNAGGGAIENASARIGSTTATTDAAGRFTLQDLPVGPATLVTSAPDYDSQTQTVVLTAGDNTFDVILAPVDRGEWGSRAGLLAANSEFALAESDGKLYVLGGYPASRQTVRTVQVYTIASDTWQLGPDLPQPNNHEIGSAHV